MFCGKIHIRPIINIQTSLQTVVRCFRHEGNEYYAYMVFIPQYCGISCMHNIQLFICTHLCCCNTILKITISIGVSKLL